MKTRYSYMGVSFIIDTDDYKNPEKIIEKLKNDIKEIRKYEKETELKIRREKKKK